jgi:glycosyltransferase involved in cell wall biosynthesis
MLQTMRTRVSVIIASHRSDYVHDVAKAFVRMLSAAAPEFEVIVVADYQVRDHHRLYPGIRWVYHGNQGISVKRNAGAALARGEILAFIDDDCVPAHDWIARGLCFLDMHQDAAGCEGKTGIERSTAAGPVSEFRRLEKTGFRTNNIFYRKSYFESAGGFDERFTVQREDADLAFSVIEAGRSIGSCDDAVVTHRMRGGEKWDLFKNCFNRRFDPLLFKKHPVLYRKYIGSPVPPGIAAVLIVHLVLPASLFVNAALWPAVAAADIALALVLSARRNRGGKNGFFWVMRDFISFLAAPIVLEGALIYGSVRYRKFLMF